MRFIGICLVLVGILTVLQVEGAKKKKNIKSTVTTDINGASSQVSDAGTPILSNADKRIAEMVPIRFDLIDSNDKPPPKGILFSWHSITSHGKKQHLQDGRFHDTVGTGNEFKVAVKSCHEAHPEIPIYLITNAKVLDRETRGLLHRVYEMDLMQESGLLQLYQETGDIKFGFGTKAYSVIRGWELGLLPDWVIHFDVDITIVSTSNKWNLHTMFEPLQFYDIAGVMEGYSTCLDPTKPDHTLAVGGGWEMNTGAFAVKRSAKILLEKWVEVFKEDPDRFAYFQSGEQQAFMLALQDMPQFRMFALPPIFNFRRATLHARHGPALPVMLHAHTFSHDEANYTNYKEVAKYASMLMFDDCYNHMKIVSGPYSFLCDMLVH